jgi:hypothetical protein
MGILKKTGISLLSWLVWVVLNYSFHLLLYIPLYKWLWQIKDVRQLDDLALMAILFPVSFVLGFLSFVISFRIVIFPIARRNNLTIDSSMRPVFFEWIIFYIIFTFLSWPIPFIQGLLSLSSLPDAVIHAVKPIGRVLVSFVLYRESALDHFREFPDQVEGKKVQIHEPA